MKKKVDLFKIALQLGGIRLALDAILTEVFHKLPEKDDGFELDLDEFVETGTELFDNELMQAIAAMSDGEIDPTNLPVPEPEPSEGPEPEPDHQDNVVRIMNTGAKMSWNGEPYDKFVFPKLGPEYTDEPFDLVFSDDNKLFVRDPEKMYMTPDNMKYQPGGPYSRNNPDIPTMEVYARKGTHPDWVEARFRHPVDTTVPDTPPTPVEPDSGWRRLEWRGDSTLGWDGHDSRDRAWWSKIHGSHSTPWSRKINLPKEVESARSLDFRLSDGSSLHVPNPKGMAMGSNGPKYRPQDGNQEPGKNAPKIVGIPKSPITWIEYKVNR